MFLPISIARDILASLLFFVFLLFGINCEGGDWGSKRVTDPKEYGKFASYIQLPEYFPESIEAYQVNGYAYSLEAFLDVCHEIFLDVTFTEEQFEEFSAYVQGSGFETREAYYAEGYYELLINDVYQLFEDDPECVGWATIDKVIYSPVTYNVVYVQFYAHDTGVFPLSDVAYFNRFDIDQFEYIYHTEGVENNDQNNQLARPEKVL